MKTNHARLFRLCMVAGLFAHASLVHAVTLSFSETLPTENLLISNPTGTGTGTALGPNLTRVLGFSFQSSSALLLETVTVQVAEANWTTSTLGKDMKIHIVALDSLTGTFPDISGSSPPTLLTQTGALPSSLGSATVTGGFYMTFAFDSQVSLQAGTAYGIVMSFVYDSTDASRLNLVASTGAAPAGVGQRYFSLDQGATWSTTGAPPVFVLTGATIPEPATAAMFLGAVALVGTMCSRRRVTR